MTRTECIAQLEDLIRDRKSFYDDDDDPIKTDEIYRIDVQALETAIKIIKIGLHEEIREEVAKLYKDFPEMSYSWCLDKAKEMIK